MSDFSERWFVQGDEVDYEAISDEETSTAISNTTAILTTILATGSATSTISPHFHLQLQGQIKGKFTSDQVIYGDWERN